MRIMKNTSFPFAVNLSAKKFPMSRKASKIITQSTPKKERLGAFAKLGIAFCVLMLAALGFLLAERLNLTGTHFLSKADQEETAPEETAIPSAPAARTGTRRAKSVPADAKKNAAEPTSAESRKNAKTPSGKSAAPAKKSGKKSGKSAAGKSAQPPTPPLPLSAFPEISARPYTWPAFVRLSRSRTISVVDMKTGASVGRMDVPAGTVVKIRKVNANGMLDVFDRTGQSFRIDASGTNFAAAFEAAKNKPKRKTVAKKKAAPEVAVKTPVPAESQKNGEPTGEKKRRFVSAFGSFDEDDWDDADDE